MSRNLSFEAPSPPAGFDWFSLQEASGMYNLFVRCGVRTQSPTQIPAWALYVYWRVPSGTEPKVLKKLAVLSDEEILAWLTLAQLDGFDGHQTLRVLYFGDTVVCNRGHERDVRSTDWWDCENCRVCT